MTRPQPRWPAHRGYGALETATVATVATVVMAACLVIILLVILAATWGCAPKRVLQPGQERDSSTATATKPAADQTGATTVYEPGILPPPPPPATAPEASLDLGEAILPEPVARPPAGSWRNAEGGASLAAGSGGKTAASVSAAQAGSAAASGGAVVSGLELGLAAASLAEDQLGKPYAYGAAGPNRFDCSGLAMWVYGNLGVSLPRVSRDQAQVGEKISRQQLRPGDLLFFALNGKGIDHVGVYTGAGDFVHAPHTGAPVRTDSLDNSWWRRRLEVIRRLD